jgi:hypothetical protein
VPKTVRCPICKKEVSWKDNPFRPFCSERCRTRDLGNWASGRYTVSSEEINRTTEPSDEKEVPSVKKE